MLETVIPTAYVSILPIVTSLTAIHTRGYSGKKAQLAIPDDLGGW